jgi:hypothetical protein
MSIAYVSAATNPMTDEDITGILVQARANNVRHELTGVLLYRDGRFIQILEGPDEAVLARYAIIASDPRHRSIHKVSEETVWVRQFPDWTMGFRPLTDAAVRQLPGFDDYFDGRVGKNRLDHAEQPAQQFLEWLSEYWFSPE